MSKYKREYLVRVIAPTLSDIAEFQKRVEKVFSKVYMTGQKRSEREDSWRGYFVVVAEDEEK